MLRFVIIVLMLCYVPRAVKAAVIEFTDRNEWMAAVESVTTIGFTEFPSGTIVTSQYATEGVTFTDGNDVIGNNSQTYQNDGAGLVGTTATLDGDINLTFSSFQYAIGTDYIDSLRITLFREGQAFFTSSDFGGTGLGFFAGLLSDQPFDAAILADWKHNGTAIIDDLHFGIPAPGVLPLFALGALFAKRRSRK